MSLFESIVINLIYVLFPILVYFIYICYTAINKNKYNDIMLYLNMFMSLYIFLRFGSGIEDSKILLFSNIPIIISYIKKEGKLGIILSLFMVIYCYYMFSSNIIFVSIKYVVYYIVYIFFRSKKINDNDFIAYMAIVQAFFLAFEYFYNYNFGIYNVVNVFMVVILFYIITFLVLYLFNFINRITNLYYQVKKLNKEIEIKNSLFKLTHEIKNPIAVCKGYLDMIDVNNKKKAQRYIDIMKQEINRSLNIMSDFLEFSRIKINKDVIEVGVLLDDVYESFKMLNKSCNISLNYIDVDDEIYIDGDYDRLKQVLLNIIKNSMEAIDNNGNITISYNCKSNKCYIVVEDDGCGMDEDTLNNIKNLFYTTKSYGSGIGVSLSNEIIRAHGGKLNYYSELGKGTRVEIILENVS